MLKRIQFVNHVIIFEHSSIEYMKAFNFRPVTRSRDPERKGKILKLTRRMANRRRWSGAARWQWVGDRSHVRWRRVSVLIGSAEGALASPLLKWRPLELASTSLAACFAAVDRVANQMPFIATQFQLKCRYFQHIQLGWQILVEQMMLVGRDPRGRLLQRNLSSKIVNPFEKKSQLIEWFLLQGWTHYLRC